MHEKNYSERELEDHIAIGALVENEKHEVLCFKHIRWNFWSFPIGKTEVDETAEAAAVRELKEELGIDVTKMQTVYETLMEYKREGKTVRVSTVLFKVLAHTGTPSNMETNKHTHFGFRSLNELAQEGALSDMLMHYLNTLGIKHRGTLQGRIVT